MGVKAHPKNHCLQGKRTLVLLGDMGLLAETPKQHAAHTPASIIPPFKGGVPVEVFSVIQAGIYYLRMHRGPGMEGSLVKPSLEFKNHCSRRKGPHVVWLVAEGCREVNSSRDTRS